MELSPFMLLTVSLCAFLCQCGSASVGMGYGTILTPILLLIGFTPLQVIPAVLLSQLGGGIIGGIFHHRAGNIRLDFRPDEGLIRERLKRFGYIPRSPDSKVILILSLSGAVGAIIGVFCALHIPLFALKVYIGTLVLGVGILIISKRRSFTFSWGRLIGVGVIASFNKGISGGGYIPLIAGGQIIAGREVKSAIGSTVLAVSVACGVSFLSYLFMKGDISWGIAISATVGSILASPLAALIVKRANPGGLQGFVGFITIALGILTIAKAFI